jgi:soluble lytic murein transglycosylase-like protein
MRPNLTNVHKVLDRIEEITRKCALQFKTPRLPETSEKRFVELLSAVQEKTEKPQTLLEGRTKGRAAVDKLRQGTLLQGELGQDDLRRKISRFAEEYNIDEELIRAVIQVESGWKSDAVSSKGARGLMQLMPRTAEMLGVEDPFDPEQNIEGGVKYLAQLTDKYEGDVEKALAAYNAGPRRVDSAGGAPFPETARYVKNVMALYHRYREEE